MRMFNQFPRHYPFGEPEKITCPVVTHYGSREKALEEAKKIVVKE